MIERLTLHFSFSPHVLQQRHASRLQDQTRYPSHSAGNSIQCIHIVRHLVDQLFSRRLILTCFAICLILYINRLACLSTHRCFSRTFIAILVCQKKTARDSRNGWWNKTFDDCIMYYFFPLALIFFCRHTAFQIKFSWFQIWVWFKLHWRDCEEGVASVDFKSMSLDITGLYRLSELDGPDPCAMINPSVFHEHPLTR